MDGVINIYKEKGCTSHDVVAQLRKILRTKKVGHTGTLDPEAEGVLPICIGKATKLSAMITEGTKGYETVLRFGKTTTTGDHTGETLQEFKYTFNEEDVVHAVHAFVGEYMQVPPMYSAIKVKGKKLYELAREGKTIEREPRKVYIHHIEILELLPPDAVKLRVICSKGTYIRTLCEDIGMKLGYGGHMDGLVRIKSGDFSIKSSMKIEDIVELKENDNLESAFISIEEILKKYTEVVVCEDKDKLLLNGNKIDLSDLKQSKENLSLDDKVRMYTSNHVFVGLYEVVLRHGAYCLKPFKILI